MWCPEHNVRINSDSGLCETMENDPVMITKRDAIIIAEKLSSLHPDQMRDYEKVALDNLWEALTEK